MKKKTGPPAVEFTSADDLKTFIDSKEVAVVGFFKNKDSEEAKQFIDVAAEVDDVEFAIASCEECMKAYEQEKDASVVLFKKVSESTVSVLLFSSTPCMIQFLF